MQPGFAMISVQHVMVSLPQHVLRLTKRPSSLNFYLLQLLSTRTLAHAGTASRSEIATGTTLTVESGIKEQCNEARR